MQQQLPITCLIGQEQYKSKNLRISKQNTSNSIKLPIGRIKSNNEDTIQKQQLTNKLLKPKSSVGKRPPSSRKPTQSTQSNTSGRSQQQAKQLIQLTFKQSQALKAFLEQKQYDQNKALCSLANNQLFKLSLISTIHGKNEQQARKYAQQLCVKRIQRTIAMEKQKATCQRIQNRLGQLFDKKIEAFNQFL